MTPQEQQMLQDLIQRVNQTQLQEKDPDAEDMLNQTLGRNQDALYILAQTVLVQQYALDQAQQQLEQLRQQQQQPRRSNSFLGGLLGRDQPATPPPPPYPPVQYAPPPSYSYGGPVGYAPPSGAFQQGGFLRGAAQTAAGVAAGALAFEGIESLLHGFDHAAGYGSGLMGQPEVINNYYGEGSEHEHSQNLSPDIEDRRDESTFSRAVDNDDHGNALFDSNDTSDDSSSFNDDSSYDDSFNSGGDDSGF